MATKKKAPAKKKAARRKAPAKKAVAKKKAAPRKRLTVAQRAEALENERRERFAMCYAANGGRGGPAYLEAGYECDTDASYVGASRLLRDAKVNQRVKFWEREFHETLFAEKSDVLRHVAEMAMFDPINLFDDEGHLLPLHKMDRATRKSVQELKILTLKGAGGIDDDGEAIDLNHITELKYGKDTRAYSDMLARHYNIYEDHQKSGANKELKIYLMYPQDALA